METGSHIIETQLPRWKDDLVRLRWRFDWIDGRIKYGAWDSHGTDPSLHAWRQNKDGLLCAAIEIKGNVNLVVRRKVECPGQDFCNFQWIAQAFDRGGGGKLPSQNIGLALVSRNLITTVFKNGEVTQIARSEEDKNFHYAGYGR